MPHAVIKNGRATTRMASLGPSRMRILPHPSGPAKQTRPIRMRDVLHFRFDSPDGVHSPTYPLDRLPHESRHAPTNRRLEALVSLPSTVGVAITSR